VETIGIQKLVNFPPQLIRSTPPSQPNKAGLKRPSAAWPDPRSRSRSWALEIRHFGHFQRICPPPFL